MCKRVSGDNPLFSVNDAGLPANAVAGMLDQTDEQRMRPNRTPNKRSDTRMARDQRSVAAKQSNGAAGIKRNRAEEFFEVAQPRAA